MVVPFFNFSLLTDFSFPQEHLHNQYVRLPLISTERAVSRPKVCPVKSSNIAPPIKYYLYYTILDRE